MANKRFYSDLKRMAKQANQRMVRLEKAGIKSPAYQAVQAKLEIMGKNKSGDKGRRFSETGKATYNEMEYLTKILKDFLYEDVTSTVSGAQNYINSVWEGANKNGQLSEAGISKEDWFEFWSNMPDKKDRIYGSEQYVAMIRAYSMKDGKMKDDNAMTMEEIAEEIERSKSLEKAYEALGLTPEEVIEARISFGDEE